MGTVVARNGRATTCQRENEQQLWDRDHLPRLRTNLLELRNKDIEHLINVAAAGESLWSADETKGNVLCTMTG